MDSPCIKQTVCKVLKIFQYGKYLVAYVLNFMRKIRRQHEHLMGKKQNKNKRANKFKAIRKIKIANQPCKVSNFVVHEIIFLYCCHVHVNIHHLTYTLVTHLQRSRSCVGDKPMSCKPGSQFDSWLLPVCRMRLLAVAPSSETL